MEKQNKLKFKKINSHIGIISKFILKTNGKRDGKKGIPFSASNDDIVSPNVKKEHDKIYSYMAYIIRVINIYNAFYYHELQSMIADLSTKVNEAINLNNILRKQHSEISMYIPICNTDKDFEDFLKSKHKLENDLDDIAIRQRRFEEYQNKLSTYRIKFNTLSIEIVEIYKNIFMNIDIIKRTFELAKPIFWEASSTIDIRLSFYWQGVLLKHPKAEKLEQTAPKPNCIQYTDYIKSKMDELIAFQQDVESTYQTFKHCNEEE